MGAFFGLIVKLILLFLVLVIMSSGDSSDRISDIFLLSVLINRKTSKLFNNLVEEDTANYADFRQHVPHHLAKVFNTVETELSVGVPISVV